MFRGINSATLDTKGRMALPARNRSYALASEGKAVVTIDMRETAHSYPSRSGDSATQARSAV